MQDYLKPLLSLAQSRKFYVAVAGAVVTYLVAKYGQTDEITLLTGILTAAGVYGTPNGDVK